MSDITESGKGWIPVSEWEKHFGEDDIVFVAYEISPTERWMLVEAAREMRRRSDFAKYLKLATVTWPEFPYSAEDIENAGREE